MPGVSSLRRKDFLLYFIEGVTTGIGSRISFLKLMPHFPFVARVMAKTGCSFFRGGKGN